MRRGRSLVEKGRAVVVAQAASGSFDFALRDALRMTTFVFGAALRVRASGRGDGGVDGEQGFEDGLEAVEGEGVGSVGLGLGGVVVDLEEDAVDAGGDGGAGEDGDELGLTAGHAISGGGRLD